MKRMYLFCSIVVLGITVIFSSALIYAQFNSVKKSLKKANYISEELESKRALLEDEVEKLSYELESMGKLEASDNDIKAYFGITEKTNTKEATERIQGYLIVLEGENICVFSDDANEPLLSVSVNKNLLNESEINILKQGIRLSDMNKVYSYLESLTS